MSIPSTLWVITERNPVFADLTTYHCWHDGAYLGAFPEPPKTVGPLDEPRGEDGRKVLYRDILADGRECIVNATAWVLGNKCICPGTAWVFGPGHQDQHLPGCRKIEQNGSSGPMPTKTTRARSLPQKARVTGPLPVETTQGRLPFDDGHLAGYTVSVESPELEWVRCDGCEKPTPPAALTLVGYVSRGPNRSPGRCLCPDCAAAEPEPAGSEPERLVRCPVCNRMGRLGGTHEKCGTVLGEAAPAASPEPDLFIA